MVDFEALVKAVAAKKVDIVCLLANQDFLDDYASEKHDMADKDGFILPGVKFKKVERERRS